MKVLEHPEQFKEGVRILMRVLRNKDGGVGNVDRHSTKIITKNPEEFDRAFKSLVETAQPNERIYSTVDTRDPAKAIRKFKETMLANDYDRNPQDFYLDISNRWVSALQQPTARASNLFLFDFDSTDQVREGCDALSSHNTTAKYVHGYITKNGAHIITEPFNYTKLPEWMHPMIHKNAMMLWAY